jgi:hypothetical protein
VILEDNDGVSFTNTMQLLLARLKDVADISP